MSSQHALTALTARILVGRCPVPVASLILNSMNTVMNHGQPSLGRCPFSRRRCCCSSTPRTKSGTAPRVAPRCARRECGGGERASARLNECSQGGGAGFDWRSGAARGTGPCPNQASPIRVQPARVAAARVLLLSRAAPGPIASNQVFDSRAASGPIAPAPCGPAKSRLVPSRLVPCHRRSSSAVSALHRSDSDCSRNEATRIALGMKRLGLLSE
jgi:hypothetical protein